MGLGMAGDAANGAPFTEKTTQLMRPHQIEEAVEEQKRLTAIVNPPRDQMYHASAIQGRGNAIRQLRKLKKQLDGNTPRAYEGRDLDLARRREQQLREDFLAGMPTHAEMRRNPAGAVDKHRDWEARNKSKILEWKNIRLRLAASGAIEGVGKYARDVANIEQFRPSGGAQELNMDNTQIPGKVFHGIAETRAGVVVFTDEEIDFLKGLGKEGADMALKLALLPIEQREQVLEIVRGAMEAERAKKPVTEETKRPTLGVGGAKA